MLEDEPQLPVAQEKWQWPPPQERWQMPKEQLQERELPGLDSGISGLEPGPLHHTGNNPDDESEQVQETDKYSAPVQKGN
jgi:hypothetical protein